MGFFLFPRGTAPAPSSPVVCRFKELEEFMMKQVFERERVIRLTVEEVDQLNNALQNAKVLKCLNGQQRQILDDAIERLAEARTDATDGIVQLTELDVVVTLRCVTFTQRWLDDMFDDFAGID
jgi:hypothetical protein